MLAFTSEVTLVDVSHVSKEDLRAVNGSLGRCLATRTFFVRFYENLFARSPVIAKKFEHVDMNRQKEVVQHGLLLMLMYARGSGTATHALERVAEVHGRKRVNVDPSLYRIWLDALCMTVRERDPECDPAMEKAWRRAMQVGIDYFIARRQSDR